MQTPIELTVLILVMVLAASLWIPYIVGVNTSPAKSTDFSRPIDPTIHPAWVHRAFRAHLNLLEQALPFTGLVLIVDRLDGFTALTATACITFLIARVAHALGMITGIAGFPLRPIIFNIGWACCLVLAFAALTA